MAGAVQLDPEFWGRLRLAAPFWRLYRNSDDGCRVQLPDGSVWPIPAQQLVAIPAWCDGVAECSAPTRHFFINCTAAWVTRRTCRQWWSQPAVIPEVIAGGYLTELADRLAANAGGLAEALRCQAVAAAAMGWLWQQVPESERDLATVEAVPELSRVVPVLEERLGDRWSVDAMAHLACCSAGHLTRLFRRHLDTTPVGWLIERRLGRAAEQLMTSGATVEAIAAACGFPNRSYFCRRFVAYFGMHPSAYRQQGRLRDIIM